jgi:hypothetical protein
MNSEPSVLDSAAEPSTTDPLSEVTRRDRKALLAACIVGLAISAGGLVPERIETFGITVSAQQEDSLLYLLAGVICYFLLAFGVYAWADLKHRAAVAAKHRERLRPVIQGAADISRRARERLQGKPPEEMEDALSDPAFQQFAALSDQIKLSNRVHRVGAIRILVDVYFPLVAGATASVVVWSSTRGFPGWRAVIFGSIATGVVTGVFLSWWKRRAVLRWWRRQRQKVRRKRQKRLIKRAEALPEGDPRRADLLARAKDLLMKNIEDFGDGIY